MNADVARSIIYEAWKERQEVVFDTSGWHRCTANCTMTKLEAYACIDGNHAIATEKCEEHPESKPVLVSDLWVCNMTGKMHVCNGGKQCGHGSRHMLHNKTTSSMSRASSRHMHVGGQGQGEKDHLCMTTDKPHAH